MYPVRGCHSEDCRIWVYIPVVPTILRHDDLTPALPRQQRCDFLLSVRLAQKKYKTSKQLQQSWLFTEISAVEGLCFVEDA